MTAIDPATIFDSNTRQFERSYRARVTAALPGNICPTDEFWRELLTVIEGFFTMTQRQSSRPPKLELERWQNIARLVDELGKELRKVRRQSRWNTINPLWSNRALSALWPVKDLAEAHVAGNQMIHTASRGRDRHREFLYGAVLDLWCRGLGQELHYSTKKSARVGPLIRFVVACVNPILGGRALAPRGLADIVDRRRVRAYTISGAKR